MAERVVYESRSSVLGGDEIHITTDHKTTLCGADLHEKYREGDYVAADARHISLTECIECHRKYYHAEEVHEVTADECDHYSTYERSTGRV